MEVKENIPAWLYKSHPNYERWKRARELSIERGKFVYSIVSNKINVKNLTVLDLGSGEGGTSTVFSEDNFVVSLELSLIRLQRQSSFVISAKAIPSEEEGLYPNEKSSTNNETRFLSEFIPISSGIEMTNKNLVNGNALQLPFSNHSFDLIIIQDVIEHLPNTSDFYSEVKRILKSNGYIYLSTPNKFSIFNILNDPHFGLPIVSVLKRESIKKYFLKHFRKDDYNRTDIAQLLSLNEIEKFFNSDFDLSLHTKFSVLELFNGNKGIIWSDFHFKLINFCKFIKLDWVVKKLAKDNFGAINKYFTPTFYMIFKAK